LSFENARLSTFKIGVCKLMENGKLKM
jgi:hypothetical protein